jgi:hypothetical protein
MSDMTLMLARLETPAIFRTKTRQRPIAVPMRGG